MFRIIDSRRTPSIDRHTVRAWRHDSILSRSSPPPLKFWECRRSAVARDEIVARPTRRDPRDPSPLVADRDQPGAVGHAEPAAALPQALEMLERHHRVVRARSRCSKRRPASCIQARPPASRPTGSAHATGSARASRAASSRRGRADRRAPGEPGAAAAESAARRDDARELTFICVPLIVNRRPVGALGVDLPFKRDGEYRAVAEVLQAWWRAMIAQAVKVSRMAEAERRRLVEENAHLRDELRDRYAFRHIIGNSAPIQAGVRAGRAGRADEHDRAHPRRVGHRQGDDRARDPLQLAAREEAVHQGELRGAARRR